jgi:hypothetical protein
MAIEIADGNKSKPRIFTLLRLSADIGSRVYESYFTTSIRRSTCPKCIAFSALERSLLPEEALVYL